MRIRWTFLAVVALAVSLVPATASAQRGEDEADIAHKIKGTVVSVDADAGTMQISTGKPPKKCKGRGRGGPRDEEGQTPPNGEEGEDNAGVSQRGRRGRRGGPRGRRGQQAQTLTVLTDDSTRIRRAKAAATLADLQEGDRVTVVILTDEETTVEEALAEPADVISAKPAKQRPKPEDEESGEGEGEGETPAPPAE
jgi:hypothetical protein